MFIILRYRYNHLGQITFKTIIVFTYAFEIILFYTYVLLKILLQNEIQNKCIECYCQSDGGLETKRHFSVV